MSARITALNLLDITDYLGTRPAVARKAARMAINDTASRDAVPEFRRDMLAEVNFPAGYLGDKNFGVSKRATDTDLTAAITARQRPTSLARFASGQSFEGARRTGGVNVKVNRGGGAKRIKGAFFVKLRRGRDTADGFNTGLAIRLKPGETLRGRKKGASGVQLAPNLYILQGPSVDQVFREVSVAGSPRIADKLVKEFTRQWVRLSGEK